MACAAKELVVRNADTMLEYQVTKRLPLTSHQKNELQKDVDLFLNQEKKIAEEMLPVIDQIKLGSSEEVKPIYKKFESFYRKISSDFSTLMARYMVKLNEKQQKEFFENMKDENERYASKTQKERREDAEEALEKFIGKLSETQSGVIRSYDQFFRKQLRTRLTRRVALHEKFKTVMSSGSSSAEKEKELHRIYIAHQEVNFSESKTLEIIQKFIPTLSAEQKDMFREKTREVKEILRYFIQSTY